MRCHLMKPTHPMYRKPPLSMSLLLGQGVVYILHGGRIYSRCIKYVLVNGYAEQVCQPL